MRSSAQEGVVFGWQSSVALLRETTWLLLSLSSAVAKGASERAAYSARVSNVLVGIWTACFSFVINCVGSFDESFLFFIIIYLIVNLLLFNVPVLVVSRSVGLFSWQSDAHGEWITLFFLIAF